MHFMCVCRALFISCNFKNNCFSSGLNWSWFLVDCYPVWAKFLSQHSVYNVQAQAHLLLRSDSIQSSMSCFLAINKLNLIFKYEFHKNDWRRANALLGQISNDDDDDDDAAFGIYNCKTWNKALTFH